MSESVARRIASLRPVAASSLRLALECARNVHRVTNRRLPEAGALAAWFVANVAGIGGLCPKSMYDEDEFYGRRGGVPAQDWRRVGTGLAHAVARLPDVSDNPAERWLAALGGRLGLDTLEQRLLALALHYRLNRCVEQLFDVLSQSRGGTSRLHRDVELLGLLLHAAPDAVAARLTGGAKLLAGGLLHLDDDGEIHSLVRLLSLLRREVPPAPDLYDQLLGTIAAEPLGWECFAHLGREAELAAEVLRAALAGRESGINILLYGPPGTGKTAFAATLAARVGAHLHPVAETDNDGGEPNRDERLANLRLAQCLVTPGDSLLLFDEAEDLFGPRGAGMFGGPQAGSRVYVHRLLEAMAVPVIFTANDIGALGPAVLRRMTMCLELRIPALATRTHLWRSMGAAEGVVLDEADAARLARLVPAAPAVAAAALRATRLAGGGAETARLIVEGVARAVRGGGLPAPEPERDAAYDPALVNADADLAALEANLLRDGAPRAVSFLLAGPPGAGKSAWVRHLAGRMGMPVLQKRASDLLHPFVGGTEHNIAAAFAEARDTHAFLVFDEADSLLLDRADAMRSWEVSQVNEMLTWMEAHTLPFAATTNLAERLDRASLRRFLVKLRFDWMTPAQARLAFRRFFGMAAPEGLDGLHTLTPADFALVRRHAALLGAADPAALLRRLAGECAGRNGGRAPVGFAPGGFAPAAG